MEVRMKKFLLLSAIVFNFFTPVFGEVHPKIVELQQHADQYPIDPRVPEIMQTISPVFMEYNGLGYQAYAGKQYDAAIDYFDKAIQADRKNSFAYYN
jgi:hypothetical protein